MGRRGIVGVVVVHRAQLPQPRVADARLASQRRYGFRPGPDFELPIGPMPSDDIRRLIELASEAAPLRAHDVDEVVRRSGGNPLFATEILRTARDVGSLDAVPLSLEATLAVQIDALDGAARKLLRYASVLGREFPRAVLEAIVRTHGSDSDLAALERLDEFLDTRRRPAAIPERSRARHHIRIGGVSVAHPTARSRGRRDRTPRRRQRRRAGPALLPRR